MGNIPRFLGMISVLKLTERTGWAQRGVPGVRETIGAHSFGVTLLVWLLAAESGVDTEKAVKMALVHDLLEAFTGDLTPKDVSLEEKHRRERAALPSLAKTLPKEIEQEVMDLIQEYLAAQSEEVRLVEKADKLDTALQAGSYEVAAHVTNTEIDLSEFLDNARVVCQDVFSKKILRIAESRRRSHC